MGLSWQQGPLAPGAIGRFLVPEPLPQRLLYVEPLRRHMRVRFGGAWVADSEDVLLRQTSLRTLYNAPSTPRGTPTSGLRAGMPSGRAIRARREGRGNTSTCPRTRASCGRGSRLLGRLWTPSTKKTNGSWAMPPIATTASTSAKPHANSWFVIMTASSPIPSGRSCCANPALRHAGTFCAPTSMSPR